MYAPVFDQPVHVSFVSQTACYALVLLLKERASQLSWFTLYLIQMDTYIQLPSGLIIY